MSEEKKNEVLGHARELDLDELDAVAGGLSCECSGRGSGAGDAEAGVALVYHCESSGEGVHETFKDAPCFCIGRGYGQDEVSHRIRCSCNKSGNGSLGCFY